MDIPLSDMYDSEQTDLTSVTEVDGGVGGVNYPVKYSSLLGTGVKKPGDVNDPVSPGERGAGPLVQLKKPKPKDKKSDEVDGLKDPPQKCKKMTEVGPLYSEEELISLIKQRPKSLIGRNTKMKKTGVFDEKWAVYDITLPAYRGLYVDESTNELRVVITCPLAGACKKYCYARKGGYVQFPASSVNSSRTLNFLMNDWNGFKDSLKSVIKSTYLKLLKDGEKLIIRWHDAGDFFSPEYLSIAYEVAESVPEVLFYAYTKQVGMIKRSKKPSNFTFNLSLGGGEDHLIDTESDKQSIVVPKSVFNNLLVREEPNNKDNKAMKPVDDSALQKIKNNLADNFKLDVDTVISYDELYNMSYRPSTPPKWNVMVWGGHGDSAAVRNDVLRTYLFIH